MSVIRKIGRNVKCPCGSDKKYKVCCLLKNQLSKQYVKTVIDKSNTQIDDYEKTYGKIPAPIGVNHQNHKIVVEGHRVYLNQNWATYTDFLFDHIKWLFGEKFWHKEVQKKPEERHPVVRLAFQVTEHQNNNVKKSSNGLFKYEADGPTLEYLSLAYDLHTLRNNQAFQSTALKRLRDNNNYRGIRYEVYAATTCLKAGFEIEYINGRSVKSKVPEFFVNDQKNCISFALEAKARQLSFSKYDEFMRNPDKIQLGVNSLLKDAFSKSIDGPYVIFLDLGLPPFEIDLKSGPGWIPNLSDAINYSGGCNQYGKDQFSLMVITNYPSRGLEGKPPNDFYMIFEPEKPEYPLPKSCIQKILEAVKLSRRVPSLFED